MTHHCYFGEETLLRVLCNQEPSVLTLMSRLEWAIGQSYMTTGFAKSSRPFLFRNCRMKREVFLLATLMFIIHSAIWSTLCHHQLTAWNGPLRTTEELWAFGRRCYRSRKKR